jgi:hypothetical protein
MILTTYQTEEVKLLVSNLAGQFGVGLSRMREQLKKE